MATTHLVRGTVPEDSPLRRLAGRTITVAVGSLPEAAVRILEMRSARIDPVVVPAPRPVPWTGIALGITAGIIAAVAAACTAILTGHTEAAWVAAGAMLLLAVALFPVLTHLEMDQ
jgi:hypothetical protein